MKVAILAGGFGTRISEESESKPKPMVEIGGRPILWHIMKHYSSYGHNKFVILCGYKGYMLKEYFANYFLHNSDITISTKKGTIDVHHNAGEDWEITLVDTGLHTMTGSRIKKAQKHLEGEDFMLTYGDGVGNIDLKQLEKFHSDHKKALTITSVQPEGRFGALDIDENNEVKQFMEKPKGDGSWINGGFFVCSSKIFEFIDEGNDIIFERAPLENLASNGELFAYKHTGFWKPMDTMRDKRYLNDLWEKGDAPWKTWND